MLIRVNPSAREPLADQIAAQVRSALAAGTLSPGDRLPPARELARSLEVNMHTVLRAYSALRDEGLIELRRGRGATISTEASPTLCRLHELALSLLIEGRRLGMSTDDLADLLRRVS
jgi:GntR family transcriptional regulator